MSPLSINVNTLVGIECGENGQAIWEVAQLQAELPWPVPAGKVEVSRHQPPEQPGSAPTPAKAAPAGAFRAQGIFELHKYGFLPPKRNA